MSFVANALSLETMPELPEVEFAANKLRTWSTNGRITRVEVHDPRILKGGDAQDFVTALKGRTVGAIERRGKWIRITLGGELRLFSHLGMTGKWVRRELTAETQRFERVRIDLRFDDGAEQSLRYVDPRIFGRLTVTEGDLPEYKALGLDPLRDGLTSKDLRARLGEVRRTIKEALLDQTRIAGIGNIQATEALWRAHVPPDLPANRLDSKGWAALARGIRDTLRYTLSLEEGDELTYVEESQTYNPFKIYGRAGEPCPRCRATLTSFVLGGRTTAYCPRCQKKTNRTTR